MLLDLGNCRSLHDLAKSIKSDGFRGELAHIVKLLPVNSFLSYRRPTQ